MTTAAPPVTQVRLDELVPNPDNPRDGLGDLDELAASILAIGLLQPLLVVPHPAGFLVVDGHRRHAAMCTVGYSRPIPVVVTEMDATERLVAAVAAGSFARPLSPIDQAKAFKRLQEMGLVQTQIAERTGVHQVTVSARLRLLQLTDVQQQAVHEGRMTLHAAMVACREIKTRPRSAPRAAQASYADDVCPACGQPKPVGPRPGVARAMVLACSECDVEFGVDQAPALNRHALEVHHRRATPVERTPVVAGVSK